MLMGELHDLYRNLQSAAGDLWRLVKFKDEYGKSFYICDEGGTAPYDAALKEAMERLERTLQASGAWGVEIAKRDVFNRSLKDPTGN